MYLLPPLPYRKIARGFGRDAQGATHPRMDQSYNIIRTLPFWFQTRPLFVLLILSALGTRPF